MDLCEIFDSVMIKYNGKPRDHFPGYVLIYDIPCRDETQSRSISKSILDQLTDAGFYYEERSCFWRRCSHETDEDGWEEVWTVNLFNYGTGKLECSCVRTIIKFKS